MASLEHAGLYGCVAENEFGLESCQAKAIVNKPRKHDDSAVADISTSLLNSDPVVYPASLPDQLPICEVTENNYKGELPASSLCACVFV
jgi:hypothetical protein